MFGSNPLRKGFLLGLLSVLGSAQNVDASGTTSVVFVFEGAGGYCPAFARARLQDPITRSSKPSAPDQQESRVTAELAIMNCALVRRVVDAQTQLLKSRISVAGVYYFAWWQKDLAHLTFEQIRVQGGASLSLRVLGYSMGGSTATEFVQELSLRGVNSVQTVLTLDPVPRGLSAPAGVFDAEEESPFIRATSARRWVNAYQRLDRSSLAVRGVTRGVQGFPVWGADINLKLTEIDFDSSVRKHHVGLLWTPRVSQELRALLEASNREETE